MNGNQFRNVAVWAVIAVLLFALFSLFQNQTLRPSSTEVSYSEFIKRVESGDIKSVTLNGNSGYGKDSSGKSVETIGYWSPEDVKLLRDKGVELEFKPQQSEVILGWCSDDLVADAAAGWCVDFLYPADAARFRQGHGLWQIQGETSHREAGPCDI